MPIYFDYLAGLIGIIIFIWCWLDFSPLRCLIISIVNVVAGIFLLSTLNSETQGLSIVLTVAVILIIFGVWGFMVWAKYTIDRYKDNSDNSGSIENWWNTVRAFDIILIIGLSLRLFVIQPFVVEGPSMEYNFHDKEDILVDKVSYHLRAPIRGEVVVFIAPKSPSDDYIKRMIGLPGDTVKIDQGKVYVNDKLLDESFLSESGRTPVENGIFQVKVGPDQYFVLGDNRPHSSDSRDWGLVPKNNLIGRAVVVVWPINMAGLVKTPNIYPGK